METKFNVLEQGTNTFIITHSDLDGLLAAKETWVGLQDSVNDEDKVGVLTSFSPITKATDEMVEYAMTNSKGYVDLKIFDRSPLSIEVLEKYKSRITTIRYVDHHVGNFELIKNLKAEAKNRGILTVIWEELGNEENHVSACRLVTTDIYSGDYNHLMTVASLWDTFMWKRPLNEINTALRDNKIYAEFKEITQQDIDLAKALGTLDKTYGVENTWELLNYPSLENGSILRKALEVSNIIYNDKLERAMIETESKMKVIETYNYTIGLSTCKPEFTSMVGTNINEKNNLDAVIFHNDKGIGSIRVNAESDLNGNKLASYLGESFGFSGGGHIKASGFTYSKEEIALDFDKVVELLEAKYLKVKGE